jgi:acetyl esterase/lipase
MHINSSTNTIRTFKYGPLEFQEGDLYWPLKLRPPVVCLLHGGFWRMPYGREQFAAVAKDLAARGYATWNIGYRRLGAAGGGWPGTFSDVALAVDYLATLVASGIELDVSRVIVVGHSAGGQLALWVAARNRPAFFGSAARVKPLSVAGLAPIVDLARTWQRGSGNGAVDELIGASPDHYPDRYAAASPIQLLPLGIQQLIIHGTKDDALPVCLSRDYVAAALTSKDNVTYLELPDVGHMEYLDPSSVAHSHLCTWLAQVFNNDPSNDAN